MYAAELIITGHPCVVSLGRPIIQQHAPSWKFCNLLAACLRANSFRKDVPLHVFTYA